MSLRLQKYIPLIKVDENTHRVFGLATAEAPDGEGEICDFATAKAAFTNWSNEAHASTSGSGQTPSYGNIRLQHSTAVAGKVAAPPTFDEVKKQIWLDTEPISEQIFKDLQRGFYRGFSIGGNYSSRSCNDCGTEIQKGRQCPSCNKTVYVRYSPVIAEVSYVDNPCLKSATFSLVKANGKVETVKFADRADAFLEKLSESLETFKADAAELVKYTHDTVVTTESSWPTASPNRPVPVTPQTEIAQVVQQILKAELERRKMSQNNEQTDQKIDLEALTKTVTAQVLASLPETKPKTEYEKLASRAKDKSTLARAASAKAAQSENDPTHHTDAMEANLIAAKAHKSAAFLIGPSEHGYDHRTQFDHHNATANYHAQIAKVKINQGEEQTDMTKTKESLAKGRKAVANEFQKMIESQNRLLKILGVDEATDSFGDDEPEELDLEEEGTEGDPDWMTRKGQKVKITKSQMEEMVLKYVAAKMEKEKPAEKVDDKKSEAKTDDKTVTKSADAQEETFTRSDVEKMVDDGIQSILKAMKGDDDGDEDDVKKAAGDCPTCGGTGKVDSAKCADCGGTGMMQKKKAAKAAGVGDRNEQPVFLKNGPQVRIMPVTKVQDSQTQQQTANDTAAITPADVIRASNGDQAAALKFMKGVRMTSEIPATVASAIASVR